MDDSLVELADLLARPLRTGADARAHEVPWRGPSGPAFAVAVPGDIEEVRAIVSWARDHRRRLIPQGANTGLVGASTPPPEGPAPVVLSTNAMADRLEVRPADAVAVVSAGVRLSALNEAASRHGLELPVDLAADPAIGAMVATNTGGSRVMAHGDMSAHVLGVQAVLADDDVSVIGDVRGLRKDNTGPDPARLLVGSAGSLGVITACAVSLTPLPAERATALIGPTADIEAVSLLPALRRALGSGLTAFEVMCPRAISAGLQRASIPHPVDPGAEPAVTVLVECSGGTGVADSLLDALVDANVHDRALAVPRTEAWALRHGITEGLASQGEVIGFDLCVQPAHLPALRAAVRDTAHSVRPELAVADFGHWGDGGVHANVVVPHDVAISESDRRALRAAVHELVTTRFAGSWSAEHGIGPTNAGQWRRSTPSATRRVLAAAKAEMDPLGVLGHPGLPF